MRNKRQEMRKEMRATSRGRASQEMSKELEEMLHVQEHETVRFLCGQRTTQIQNEMLMYVISH